MSNATEYGSEQSRPLRIHVNGEPRDVPPEQTVASLLVWLKVQPDRVAIEMDKAIVRKRDWAATSVQEGSQVEIVEFVGGG